MKTKLVLWGQKGSEENTEKVLIAIELKADENCIETLVFEGETASQELYDLLMNNWRKGELVTLPENHILLKRDLSASETIIPEGYSADDKEDLIKRTQTEWLFIVLSTKLFKTYESELEELKEKVEKLPKYSKELWEELKAFQNKIQAQTQEQNLFREHTNILRDRLNELFGTLKRLREVEDSAFEAAAKEAFDKIVSVLANIENAVEQNLGEWAKWFDQLKGLQSELKNVKLTRDGRNELWSRIDKAFKEVKERRFGNQQSSGGGETRIQRRIEGLREAIRKMEDSVTRDEKELDFQHKKLNSSNANQLETQLREVRAKMIQDRLNSKREKLADMNKTLADLEARLTRILAKSATEEDLKVEEEIEETADSENEISEDPSSEEE